MQKEYVSFARTNRLIALATLAARKAEIAQVRNVHQFPVSRNTQSTAVFATTRGKRMNAVLAA